MLAKLSPTMEEGTIVKWTKKEGDAVKVGDVLAEIETDKANMEMEALGAGVLRKILVPAGGKAPVGALIGVIADPNEDIAAMLSQATAAAPAAAPAPSAPPPAAAKPAAPTAQGVRPPRPRPRRVRPSLPAPRARGAGSRHLSGGPVRRGGPGRRPRQGQPPRPSHGRARERPPPAKSPAAGPAGAS